MQCRVAGEYPLYTQSSHHGEYIASLLLLALFYADLFSTFQQCLYMQGTYCQVPAKCHGSLDSQGNCCEAELSSDLTCCEVLDRDMQCCASGNIDASGTCNGLSRSIDVQGLPCKVCPPLECEISCKGLIEAAVNCRTSCRCISVSASHACDSDDSWRLNLNIFIQGSLDASGMCCYSTVDSFGVCNGWDASGQVGITLLAGSGSWHPHQLLLVTWESASVLCTPPPLPMGGPHWSLSPKTGARISLSDQPIVR